MSLRKLLFTASAASLAVVLTACAGGSGPTPTGSSGAATSTPTVKPAPVLATVSDAQAGATLVTMDLPAQHVSAQVPRFAKARNLSTAVEVVRGRMLRSAWQADATDVKVTSSTIASSDAVLGVQLKAVTTTAKGISTTIAHLWYSNVAEQTYTSTALVKAAAWPDFVDAVKKSAVDAGVDAAKATAALTAMAAPYGDAPALGFSSAGELLATYSSGALGADPVTLRLPAADASELLGLFGQQALDAARKPSAFSNATAAKLDPELATGVVGKRPSTAVGYDCRVVHCAAITYDDGPSAMTPTLLKTAKKAKASITFFQMGNSIKEYPEIARQVAAAGMEIGSHTVTHPNLPAMSDERITRELAGNSELIKGFTGATPLLFRPPYGAHNDRVDAVAEAQGQAVVQWELDTNDWKSHSAAQTVAEATKAVDYHATIVLEHDVQQASIDAAPEIYSKLNEAKVQLVSVSELSVNSGGYLAGHGYCRGTSLDQQGYACKG